MKFRIFRNFIGNFKGISGCLICGDTWNWKKEHNIGGNGAFPFCEECWQTKSDGELIRAAFRLGDLWKADPYQRKQNPERNAELDVKIGEMLATLNTDLSHRFARLNELQAQGKVIKE